MGRDRRIIGSLLGCLAVAIVALSPSCAWQPGQPWGELRVRLASQWQVPSDRQLADGRFRTASEYLWKLEEAEVTWHALDAIVAPEGAALAFDPAKPPAGYSTCHGGHCHADDGRLVDYADIQAELLGGAGGSTTVTLAVDATQALVLAGSPPLALAATDLPLGELRTLRLRASGLQVRARVWDGQPGSPRLPATGVEVVLQLPPLQVAAQVSAKTGLHEPLQVNAALLWRLPVSWLDAADVAAWSPPHGAEYTPPVPAAQGLAEAAMANATLQVAVTRSQP